MYGHTHREHRVPVRNNDLDTMAAVIRDTWTDNNVLRWADPPPLPRYTDALREARADFTDRYTFLTETDQL